MRKFPRVAIIADREKAQVEDEINFHSDEKFEFIVPPTPLVAGLDVLWYCVLRLPANMEGN